MAEYSLAERDAVRLSLELPSQEVFFDDVPAWFWPEFQSGTLAPHERLMVAMYESAIKDLTHVLTSKNKDRWIRAYDALCWFLNEEKRCWCKEGEEFVEDGSRFCQVESGGYPFGYVCEVLGWDPDMLRSKSRREFLGAGEALLRKQMQAAVKKARKARNGGRKEAYKVLCWILSEGGGKYSFLAACGCFGLNPKKARREFRLLFRGKKGTGYFTELISVLN